MNKRVAQVQIIVYKMVRNEPLFLLFKRVPERGGFWQAITGGVNEGEDLSVAAKRELFEETKIKDYIKFLRKVYYFEFDTEEYGRIKEYVFAVEVDDNTEAVISNEHSEQKWCSYKEALSLLKYESNKDSFKKLYSILNKKNFLKRVFLSVYKAIIAVLMGFSSSFGKSSIKPEKKDNKISEAKK
ncbi:MAG: NUDIX pyrophosphatase [Patescibacteria group bacterium]|jgi:dATP pyrophosphohydrolase|nr:NUDIX pyrophosphatase [Patescibacteria group bacterium]